MVVASSSNSFQNLVSYLYCTECLFARTLYHSIPFSRASFEYQCNHNLLTGAPFHKLFVLSIASFASFSILLNNASHVGTSWINPMTCPAVQTPKSLSPFKNTSRPLFPLTYGATSSNLPVMLSFSILTACSATLFLNNRLVFFHRLSTSSVSVSCASTIACLIAEW